MTHTRPGTFPLSDEVHPGCAATRIRVDTRAYHAVLGKHGIIRIWLRWHDDRFIPAIDLHPNGAFIIVHGLLEAMDVGDARVVECTSFLLRAWFGVDVRTPVWRSAKQQPKIDLDLWTAQGAQVLIQRKSTAIPLSGSMAAAMAASWLPQYCKSLLARKGLPPAIPDGACAAT